MYGGSGKLGRGGGGGRGGAGAGKRNIHSAFNPPPLNRASAGPTGRLSMPGSGPRGRATTSSSGGAPSSSGTGSEETFSLVTGNPLNFAMIIRLAPDLVEEIKRVEEQGGSARIKFDANANNPAGNVINVGGKDFRFTWSREPGDLCDIYEERKSGEDGNGMLVESGCAWRKLNVQRVLDESTKNHVKMRSEEAERKHKSRKAIVLDPANPSMKSQMKALAAAETNPWRMPFKHKKEPPFKKRKTEPPPGPPTKSMYKSGLSTTPSKGRPSTSPQMSPPQQSGAPGSPFGGGNPVKGRASGDNILSAQAVNKATISEKEMPSKVINSGGRDKQVRKREVAKPADLRSMLISLLKENPLGMSLKALEKAVGDAFPNSAKQIEPIIKKIATYQAPGKYLLKQGPETEGFNKPSAADGSSPSDNRHMSPVHAKYDQLPASRPSFSMRTDRNELEEFGQLGSKAGEASIDFENTDIEHHSPDLSGEKKNPDRVEPVASSSDSGSDSDSESDSSDSGSDSGSRSRSRSKSKSPVGSGSESSSDSESDASLNSKEASDEDVDIMTSDDEKESKQNLEASEPGALKFPFAWRADAEPGKIGTDEKHDDDVDVVEIEKDLLDDDHGGQMAGAMIAVSDKESHRPEEETKPPSPEHSEHRENQVFAEHSHIQWGNMAREEAKREQSKNSDRVSKSKSRKGLNEKHSDGKPDRSKRSKTTNSNQPFVTGTSNLPSAESPYNPSPDRLHIQIEGNTAREGNADLLQKGYGQGTYGKSNFESQQPSRRSYDPGARPKAAAAVDRSSKHAESAGHGVKYSERSLLTDEGSPLQKEKFNGEEQNDDSFIKDKRSTKFPKEAVGDKQPTPVDSNYGKRDMLGKFKEGGSVSNMQMLYSSKDENTNDVHRSPVENGPRNNLRREPSDLELGELREPLPEETPGYKKLFERKNSFKQSENRPMSSEYWNSDSNKGKPAGRVTSERRETPPANATKAVSGILEGSKRRNLDNFANDSARYHQGMVQPQPEQNQSRIDRTEPGSLYNKLAEVISNNREPDASMGSGTVNSLHQHDARRGVVPLSSRQNKKPQSSASLDERPKDTSRTESNDGGQKRRESSSDENSLSYSKYEKEEPELKGPIKDLSQYEEYVQEYNEKYESYLSLNKILESYRNEFSQLGKDLEASKGRDMRRYYDLLAQLKESYRQCGVKHKRLKKIFIVLHEELKHLKQMIKDFAASYLKD